MVKPFLFAKVPQIIFRIGGISALPDQISSRGRRLALVTGKNSFTGSSAAEKLFDDLEKKKIDCHVISIHGEPSPDDIDNAVYALNDKSIDVVAGVGGGSVIDAGKAISAMINRSESVVRFLEGVGDLEHPGTKLPYIALPTTSGTGSEATKNAVISKIGINGFKKSLRHDNFVPDLSIVDPELTLRLPV